MAGRHVALLGAGRWGALICRDLCALGADVTVVDPSADALAAASGAGASRTVFDLEAVDADGVDGWVVATPASTHQTVLDRLSELDGPVFCEKPLTTSASSARRLASALGDRLHLMHVWRYHPGIELLGQLARSGAVGEVHGIRSTRANWTSPRQDVDPVWTLLPHDLTIAIEVLGVIPDPRAALCEWTDGSAVGVWALLGGADQPFAVLEASTRFADKRREVRLHGSHGVAVLPTAGSASVEVHRGDGLHPSVEEIPLPPGQALRRELQAFLEHLDGGPPPKSGGAEGAAVVAAVESILDLARVVP